MRTVPRTSLSPPPGLPPPPSRLPCLLPSPPPPPSDAEETIKHFPMIYQTCLKFGCDITSQPIPVVPAAHYQCGGVMADLHGATSVAGLFAAGEVAYTGLHGANRLASNSLLEALVFARRAAEAAVAYSKTVGWEDAVPDWVHPETTDDSEWVLISHNRDELQRVMWDYVGIVRSNLRLARAERRIKLLTQETEDFFRRSKVSLGLCELRNMISAAYLIVRSAQMRRESRGLHYTVDYPKMNAAENRPTIM
eukprot:jgi/Mesvir1/17847/Mv25073-RA.1